MQVVREQITRTLSSKPTSLELFKNKVNALNYSEILKLRQTERLHQEETLAPPVLWVAGCFQLTSCCFIWFICLSCMNHEKSIGVWMKHDKENQVTTKNDLVLLWKLCSEQIPNLKIVRGDVSAVQEKKSAFVYLGLKTQVLGFVRMILVISVSCGSCFCSQKNHN